MLLLGVGHDKNTSLHLAERKAFGARHERVRNASPICVDGRRRWVEYSEPLADPEDFPALGDALEATARTLCKRGGARSMSQRELVDFGARWLAAHRPPSGRYGPPV